MNRCRSSLKLSRRYSCNRFQIIILTLKQTDENKQRKTPAANNKTSPTVVRVRNLRLCVFSGRGRGCGLCVFGRLCRRVTIGTPMVIFAVWLFLTIGTLLFHLTFVMLHVLRVMSQVFLVMLHVLLQCCYVLLRVMLHETRATLQMSNETTVYQQCTNRQQQSNSKNDHWCTNRHMSTHSPPNTQSRKLMYYI